MAKKEVAPKVPWLTKDGIVMRLLPLEGNYRRAAEGNEQEMLDSCTVLGSCARDGRKDATVFLLGLLCYVPEDSWNVKASIVSQLEHARDVDSIPFLTRELRTVRSSNTTRRYLDAVLKALRYMPKDAVLDQLQALSLDSNLTPKMRQKIENTIDSVLRVRVQASWL